MTTDSPTGPRVPLDPNPLPLVPRPRWSPTGPHGPGRSAGTSGGDGESLKIADARDRRSETAMEDPAWVGGRKSNGEEGHEGPIGPGTDGAAAAAWHSGSDTKDLRVAGLLDTRIPNGLV